MFFKTYTIADIDELKVWQSIIGRGVELNEKFNSPFRTSSSLSCSISLYKGYISFSSFSPKDSQYCGWSCVKAYSHLTGIPYKDCFKILAGQFKFEKVYETKEKRITKIVPEYCDWTPLHLNFWLDLGINPTGTIIRPISSYLIQKVNHPRQPAFAYCYEEGVKIYAPFENKDFKWRGNLNKNTTVWTKNGSDTILVCKSLKDQLVAESLLGKKLDYIHAQSENYLFSHDLSRYKKRILFWDSDDVGKLKSFEFCKLLNAVPLFTNVGKDLAEMCKEVGRAETFKWLYGQINRKADS